MLKSRKRLRRTLVHLAAVGLLSAGSLKAQTTLTKVRAAGALNCGLNREEPEYSNLDAHGNRALLDVDLCKAVAVAVLGPKARFNMMPFPDEVTSLNALRAGTVDLVATASPTMTNNAKLGFAFGPVMLFDYQALMVNNSMGVHNVRDLAGRKICYLTETSMELNLNAWMERQHIQFLPFPFQEEGEMEAAYLTNNCAAITADATQLAYERIAFRAKGREYQILPDVLAMDPLASATRGDDPAWTAIVRWVETALIAAEESGITAANAGSTRLRTNDPAVQQFLAVTPGIGKSLGLDDEWAFRTVEAVGNYGEVYQRDLGTATPMRLDRGMNRLWIEGGQLIAQPMR